MLPSRSYFYELYRKEQQDINSYYDIGSGFLEPYYNEPFIKIQNEINELKGLLPSFSFIEPNTNTTEYNFSNYFNRFYPPLNFNRDHWCIDINKIITRGDSINGKFTNLGLSEYISDSNFYSQEEIVFPNILYINRFSFFKILEAYSHRNFYWGDFSLTNSNISYRINRMGNKTFTEDIDEKLALTILSENRVFLYKYVRKVNQLLSSDSCAFNYNYNINNN